MSDYIAPIGWGIGDLLVSLPAVQGLIDAGRGVVLVARAPAQAELAERIDGLAGVVAGDGLDPAALGRADRWHNLRDHPLQRDWWWGSPEFQKASGGMTIDAIVERIASDLGIPRGASGLVALRHGRSAAATSAAGRILFVPASDASPKLWRETHWLTLARRLSTRRPDARPAEAVPTEARPTDTRATDARPTHAHPPGAGIPLAVIGLPDQAPVAGLRQGGMDWIPTPSLGDAVDAVSAARAVVAVDTGLFHLAVQQGVPAVGLFRRESVFRRDRPGALSICAPACDPACVAADVARAHHKVLVHPPGQQAPGWTCVRPEEERCMARLEPGEVLDALASLGVRPAW